MEGSSSNSELNTDDLVEDISSSPRSMEFCDVDMTCPLSPSPASDHDIAENIGDQTTCKVCAVCRQTNARYCTNCRQISYCGKDHQIEHWRIHKETCFPVKVVDKSTIPHTVQSRSQGQVLIATRDIKAAEVFFKENVILTAPGPLDSDAIEVAKGRPICVSCCEIIRGCCEFDDDDDEDCTTRCTNCQWPVCNHDCEIDKRHCDYECKVLSAKGVSSMVLNQMPDYECILVLRALELRDNDSERWMRLLNLEAPVNLCMDGDTSSLFLNSAVKFVREKCGLKQYPDSLIRQVAAICYVNSLCNEDHPGDNGYVYKIATYIADVSSKVAHSCIANSEWAVIPSEVNQVHFRALVPIKAGEVITTVYNYKAVCPEGSLYRQEFFLDRYFFSCSCQRCTDPEELSTFVSAVKCPVDGCVGYLLPTEPGQTKSMWVCNAEVCSKIESGTRIQRLVQKIRNKLEAYPYKDPMHGTSKHMNDLKKRIMRLKKLVDKYSGTLVHPNHYVLLQAEWKIIQNGYNYIMNVNRWTPDVTDLVIHIGRKHLEIFNKLSPGVSRRRGYILYFLQTGLLESIRNGTASISKTKRGIHIDPDKQESLRAAYADMMKMREESVKIFSFKGAIKNSMEEELLNFSATDQPFISCLKFLDRFLDQSMEQS